MRLTRPAMEAAAEPEFAADAGPNCCKRCGITLSALLADHQGVFCPACVTVCVAGVVSDWEGAQRSSRRFIAWLRRRKPLWKERGSGHPPERRGPRARPGLMQ